MLKIEKKSIRVIYTSFWKCISFRKFPPRGTFHSIESFHDSLYIYMYIVCKLEGKGNFKGNNRSIGFNLFDQLAVSTARKKRTNSSPPSSPCVSLSTDLSTIKFYTLYLQNDFIIHIIFPIQFYSELLFI